MIGESHRLHLRERARVECFEVPTVGADYEALAVRAIPRGAGGRNGAAPARVARRDDALGVVIPRPDETAGTHAAQHGLVRVRVGGDDGVVRALHERLGGSNRLGGARVFERRRA